MLQHIQEIAHYNLETYTYVHTFWMELVLVFRIYSLHFIYV